MTGTVLGKASEETFEQGACEQEPRRHEPLTEGLRLLYRNPQLAKVVLAAGVQQAGGNVPEIFVVSVLRGTIWGARMSEFTAASMIVYSVVALTAGGPFGRFSDRVDRRVAAAIFGVGSFLPAWTLFVFLRLGMPEAGLWASTAAKILGAFGTSSNVMVALVNDVTPAEDKELAMGVYFAGTNLTMLLLQGVPVFLSLVFHVLDFSNLSTMVYQAALSALFFALVLSISPTRTGEGPRQGHDLETTKESGSGRPAEAARACGCTDVNTMCLEPLRLVLRNGRLRRLWLAAFLLAFSGSLVMDIGGQFFNQSLGLLPYGTVAELQRVSALTMLPGAILVIPGFLLMGHLTQSQGTLRLLRTMIPITALLTCSGVLMMFAPMWLRWDLLPLIVVAQNYAQLVQVPLLRLVAAVAPPGRVGESLAAAGVAGQCANMVGNIVVVIVNPWVLRLTAFNALGMYYPVCALLSLCALLPVSGSPRGGWGFNAGRVEDGVYAAALSVRAKRLWRGLLQRRRAEWPRSP